jgi:hypothetical protein
MCSGDLGLVHILTLQCAQFCSCWGMAVAILARTVWEVVSSLLAFVWQLSYAIWIVAAGLCGRLFDGLPVCYEDVALYVSLAMTMIMLINLCSSWLW